MILSKCKLRLITELTRLRTCTLCTQEVPRNDTQGESFVEDEQIIEATTLPRKKPMVTRGHLIQMTKFFNTNAHLLPYKEYIPKKYLVRKAQNPPEVMYLLCPKIAQSIASHVLPILNSQGTQIVAETSPGLGHITSILLDSGIKMARLYEGSSDFHFSLKELYKENLERLEIFSKDIFNLNRYAYMDRQDHGNRVVSLLKDVPKKSWSADPAMTIIGGMPNLGFLRFLMRSLGLQNEVSSYGRFQVFAIMRPADYAVLTATPDQSYFAYKYWSILLQLFMDFQLLDKYEKKYFIPWTFDTVNVNRYPLNLDPHLLYLVKINFKQQLPMNAEDTLQFFYFVKQFYGKGARTLIPTIEKWVPNCGINIMLPKLNHEDYFDNIGIYTKFSQLTPRQILGVFNEMKAFPTYNKSPFMAMVENELLASETIESDLHDEFERNVKED